MCRPQATQNRSLNATRSDMIKTILQIFLVVSIVASSLACAAKRPVLGPNARLEAVGIDAAQQDIDDCLSQARPESGQAGKIAGSTALGAATGAAVGAVAGAVVGGAARGAAAGAAGGATGGFLQGLFTGGRKLDPEQRQRVEQCLHDKGYAVSGWE
jgi:outer membrane lipoprotein SlyB